MVHHLNAVGFAGLASQRLAHGFTEAGKSSLIDNVITPLIAAVGGVTCGEGTTAAGIRQSVKHDALPIIIDEFESDDEKARRRVDEIISMVRGSSSNQGAQVLKGTTSGQSLSYLMRSSFLFASIDVGLEKAQDQNRTSVVRFQPLTAHQRGTFAETVAMWRKVTPELGRKLLTRSLRLLPVIQHNAEELEAAITRGGHRPSQRIAKVEGLLLAAAHSTWSEERLDERTADDLVNALLASEKPEPEEAEEKATNTDAVNCLRHLLLWQFDVVKEIRSGGYDRREKTKITVQAACENYLRPGAYDLEEVATELKKHGLMVRDYQGKPCLLVAPPHPGVKSIYRNTSWRDPRETLKRDGANGEPTAVISFGGRQFKYKALAFPLENLVDMAEVPKTKVENMTPAKRWKQSTVPSTTTGLLRGVRQHVLEGLVTTQLGHTGTGCDCSDLGVHLSGHLNRHAHRCRCRTLGTQSVLQTAGTGS